MTTSIRVFARKMQLDYSIGPRAGAGSRSWQMPAQSLGMRATAKHRDHDPDQASLAEEPARNPRRRRRRAESSSIAEESVELVPAGKTPVAECRRDLRRVAACRAAGADQHAPPFLPDADAGAPGRDQQGAVRLADRALSDLGAARAGCAAAGDPAGADGTDDVRRDLLVGPSLSSTRRGWRTRSTSRRRRRRRSACAWR